MSARTPEWWAALSGEALRKEAGRADRAFGAELDRAQIADERLRNALNWMLEADAEQRRRKNV